MVTREIIYVLVNVSNHINSLARVPIKMNVNPIRLCRSSLLHMGRFSIPINSSISSNLIALHQEKERSSFPNHREEVLKPLPATEKSWDVAAALHLYPVDPQIIFTLTDSAIVFGLHSSGTVSRYPIDVASTKT